jgi:excisionase family DNA binding protein
VKRIDLRNKFYTIQEVADILGVGKTTIYNWERLGKIPKARRELISNYRIFTNSDVEKLQRITGRKIKEPYKYGASSK